MKPISAHFGGNRSSRSSLKKPWHCLFTKVYILLFKHQQYSVQNNNSVCRKYKKECRLWYNDHIWKISQHFFIFGSLIAIACKWFNSAKYFCYIFSYVISTWFFALIHPFSTIFCSTCTRNLHLIILEIKLKQHQKLLSISILKILNFSPCNRKKAPRPCWSSWPRRWWCGCRRYRWSRSHSWGRSCGWCIWPRPPSWWRPPLCHRPGGTCRCLCSGPRNVSLWRLLNMT